MKKELEKPEWYPLDVYSKRLTTKEWLYEIWKRDLFSRDEILKRDEILPFSIRLLSVEEGKDLFKTFVFAKNIEGFLSLLKPEPQKPIRPLSISDVFRMYTLIVGSEWYKNCPDKQIFESAIQDLANDQRLTHEQKTAYSKYYDTPWYDFHEKSQDETWYPNKEFTHLTGIPTSIDPGYAKDCTAKVLKSQLTKWVGKTQDIELQLAQCHECKILAVFDLKLWLALERTEYTNISLHKLIWPNGRHSSKTEDYVNPDDDIEYITRLIEKAINQNVVRKLTLLTQANLHEKETKKK